MKLNHSHSFRSRKMQALIENLIATRFSLNTRSSNICEYRVMRILESCVVYFNNLDIVSINVLFVRKDFNKQLKQLYRRKCVCL